MNKIKRIREILNDAEYAFTRVKSTDHKLFSSSEIGSYYLDEKTEQQIKLENKQLLNEMWHLKDHIKKWLKSENKSDDIVEQRINNSKPMGIIGDIVTELKHGEHRIDRSGLNPRLGSVEAFLKVNKGEVIFERHPDNRISINASPENPVYFTVAIIDEKGNRIGTVASLCEVAIIFWREVLNDLNFPFE